MNDMRKSLEQAGHELEKLREELELKAHLAKMDAKDAMVEIEPVLHQLEKKIEEAITTVADVKERARLQATLGMADLKKKLTH